MFSTLLLPPSSLTLFFLFFSIFFLSPGIITSHCFWISSSKSQRGHKPDYLGCLELLTQEAREVAVQPTRSTFADLTRYPFRTRTSPSSSVRRTNPNTNFAVSLRPTMMRKYHTIRSVALLLCLSTFAWVAFKSEEHVAGIRNHHTTDFGQWAKPCKKVLFDLGANRGDTIERWFSEKMFKGRNNGWDSVDNMFPAEERKEFCVASFEPNPRFTETLQKVSEVANAGGHRSKVFTNTAVGDKDGIVSLFLDESSTHGYGSSVVESKKVNFGGKYHSLGKKTMARQVELRSMLEELAKGKLLPKLTSRVPSTSS